LVPDFDSHEWKPRGELVMASKASMGDYRRVSKEVWNKFCEYYPGSGPEINMAFKEVVYALLFLLFYFL